MRSRFAVLLALAGSFAFGATVRIASAGHYHTNCVAHGFVHGDSTTDGSFFSRVDAGCGSTGRSCNIYTWGSFVGGQSVAGTTAGCNAWSRQFSQNLTECASYAQVYSAGVFSTHNHLAHNWCG